VISGSTTPPSGGVASACGSAASAGPGDWHDPGARSRPGRRDSVDAAHSSHAQAAGTRVSRPKPQSNALLAKTAEGSVYFDWRDQIWAIPPSTKISLPVMKRLSSQARKLTTFATSEGTPFRPIGAVSAVWAK